MEDNRASPMVKFFCPTCGKEVWFLIDWNYARQYTLNALRILLVCSDCLLGEIRDNRRKDKCNVSMAKSQ